MFWVIDNFLMRKSKKLLSLSSAGSSAKHVQYVNSKNKHYVGGASDDEVHMHLMANEASDTFIGSGSENDMLFRRNGSESSYK